jgi:hypothetical protein
MNTDKHGLKRTVSSAFIGVHRRLKMLFSDFFSTLFLTRRAVLTSKTLLKKAKSLQAADEHG